METAKKNIDWLMCQYRNNPTRKLRCGSVSCKDGILYSYDLPIARYVATKNFVSKFYVLHDPQSSRTTNRHVSKIRWWLASGIFTKFREVPYLYASEAQITEHFAGKLNRIYERFKRSKHIKTAYEYFVTHNYYSKHAHELPEIPNEIRLLAELEGWNKR